MYNRLLCCLFLSFCWFGCSENNETTVVTTEGCGVLALIDDAIYAADTPVYFTINAIEIDEDCLAVNISSGGCDGTTWELGLVTQTPETTTVNGKLVLENEEPCDAYLMKDFFVDLSSLQQSGASEVTLVIEDWGETIIYNY